MAPLAGDVVRQLLRGVGHGAQVDAAVVLPLPPPVLAQAVPHAQRVRVRLRAQQQSRCAPDSGSATGRRREHGRWFVARGRECAADEPGGTKTV